VPVLLLVLGLSPNIDERNITDLDVLCQLSEMIINGSTFDIERTLLIWLEERRLVILFIAGTVF
jgi:hypothetical protein